MGLKFVSEGAIDPFKTKKQGFEGKRKEPLQKVRRLYDRNTIFSTFTPRTNNISKAHYSDL